MSYQYHIKPKEHAYHACSVTLSNKGWMSNYITEQWFLKCFIHQAKARNTSGKPMLLIFDGHHSHETIQLCDAALEDNIHLYCIPPHTSHHLQPLDVGVFGLLQRAWQKQSLLFLEERGESITHQDVTWEYMMARTESIKESTILSAWRKSGINPFDPEIFTTEDMAPSFVTLTNVPLPESFPDLPSDSKVSYRTSGDETYVDSSDGLDSEGGGEKDHDNGDNQDDNAEHVSAESHAIIPHQEISSDLNMHHSTIATPPLSQHHPLNDLATCCIFSEERGESTSHPRIWGCSHPHMQSDSLSTVPIHVTHQT